MEFWREKMYTNELQHHGILGMKWGVRRYQNEDGTLTPAGKIRYADEQKKSDMRQASKNRRSLSTDEIRGRIERIRLERQLKDLTDEEITPGRKFVKDLMSQSGKKVLSTAVTGAALYAAKVAVTKDFNPKEFGTAIFNGGAKKK